MTVPHTSGTITLVKGSADVTGIDTGWAAALIVGGVLFVNVANVGAMALPVKTVDSNTKITAAIPWNGANGTYTYALVRDGAYERQSVENAIKTATLLNEIRSLALTTLSTLTPAVDKVPYFGPGGAGALADFNAAARALLAGTGILPNSQLPASQTGKTFTSLSTMTGLNNNGSLFINTAGSTLSFQRNNADSVDIEAFLQGGGAKHRIDLNRYGGGVTINGRLVFERGSNAAGEYVRIGDGTQLCWRTLNLGYSTVIDMSSISSFAAAFSVTPAVFVSASQTWPSGVVRNFSMAPRVVSRTTTSANILAANSAANNQPNDLYTVDVFAIGRWF